MSKTIAIIIYGLPGAGKTTFAKQLENIIPNCVRLSNDELRVQMGLPLFGENYTELVYNEAFNRAAEIIESNKIPILDATFFLKKYRTHLYQKLNKYFPFYLFLHINTPLNICRERIINRGSDSGNGVNNIKVLAHIVDTFEGIHKSEIPGKYSIVDIDLIKNNVIRLADSKIVEPALTHIIQSIINNFNHD